MLDFNQIKAKYPSGSKGGQCVIFCRKLLLDLPYGLNSKTDKREILMASGKIVDKTYPYKIGDMIVTGEGKYGHVAIINEVLAVKDKVIVSESNYKLDEKITHNRIVDLNSTKLEYFWRSNLTKIFMSPEEKALMEGSILTLKGVVKSMGGSHDVSAGNQEVCKAYAMCGQKIKECITILTDVFD